MSMREAGAGTNDFSLAHMRRERMDRLEKQVDKNSDKLFNPSSDTEDSEDDSMDKIQNAKSIVQEFKKQSMDGTEGADFSTSLDSYD